VTFIVVMDLPGAASGRMPRAFYRSLARIGARRIQQSVYLVTGVTDLERLVSLGREHGFEVQVFKVLGLSEEEVRLFAALEANVAQTSQV